MDLGQAEVTVECVAVRQLGHALAPYSNFRQLPGPAPVAPAMAMPARTAITNRARSAGFERFRIEPSTISAK
jgi:hypothetical protein